MDAEGNVIPALAETYETSDDGLVWTFKLRDANWANGDPITANDFVYAWQQANIKPTAEYNYLFTQDGSSVVNAKAVQAGEVDTSDWE